MSNSLIRDAAKIFDSSNRWDSFLEMITLKESIVQHWYDQLHTKIFNKYSIENETWGFISRGNGSYSWFLKGDGYGPDSLAIWLEGYTKFSLWAAPGSFDSDKIRTTLKSEKYSQLIETFGGQLSNNSGYQITEDGNFTFSDASKNGSFDRDSLAWFAGNKTEELFEQICKKVDNLLDDSITTLIKELCIPKI